jgi:hypothetical protein
MRHNEELRNLEEDDRIVSDGEREERHALHAQHVTDKRHDRRAVASDT